VEVRNGLLLRRQHPHAVEAVRGACPGSPIAFLPCDVLPDTAMLGRMMRLHAATGPSDFWFPMVLVPEDPAALGASQWKPTAPLTPAGSARPERVLPGHLVVIEPEALRRLVPAAAGPGTMPGHGGAGTMAPIPIPTHVFLVAVPILFGLGAIAYYLVRGRHER
jgi:hypothetical protein